ncbi:MAG: hypothetical protein HDS65_05905 [Bacteroidales bacterium]|nr:hypothetical protein [Bacteroidales bacterium]
MALLNAVVLTSKTNKGGRNKVRISVAHNGETRYIVTDIILDSNKEFKNGMVVKRADAAMLNTKIRNLLQRYQSALDELEYINGLTCPELVFQLRHAGSDKHRTLKSIYEEYVTHARIKPATKKRYHVLWNNIERYLGDKVLAEHITHVTILGFDKFLRDRKLTSSSVRNNVVFLMILLNYAKRCAYVQFRVDPFWGYDLPKMEVRQLWLSVDEVKKIRDLESSKPNIMKCRDIFMLSYYLGGINMIDLLDINFKEQTDIIRYVRKKTEQRPKLNKFVEFVIPEEAKAIINRYKGDDGYIKLTKYQKINKCHQFFRTNMPKLAEATGIKQLIYYAARKSFSQHAFDLGVSTSVIDYILGHRVDKSGTSLYAYITVTPDMATKAIRKVLDNLKDS